MLRPQALIVSKTRRQPPLKDVLEASKSALVLVDFWAAWCGPCKALTPVIEKVVRSYGGKVRLVKMNTDEHPTIAGQLRVQSLPTVWAFRDGRPLDSFSGALPESQIRQFIDRLLADDAEADIAAVLQAADDALDANDLQSAAEAYAAILQDDQQNVAALCGLAKCYLKSGDIARAEQMLTLVPPAQTGSAAVMSVRAALDLAAQANKPDDGQLCKRGSMPIQPTITRASIWLSRSQPAVKSKRRSIICSISFAATASGTRKRPANSLCSCLMPGVQRTI